MTVGIPDMPQSDETLLQTLRRSLRGKMNAQHKPTAQSLIYRQNAATLAREADQTVGLEEQIELIKRALQWIQIAENEEFLDLHAQSRANDNSSS